MGDGTDGRGIKMPDGKDNVIDFAACKAKVQAEQAKTDEAKAERENKIAKDTAMLKLRVAMAKGAKIGDVAAVRNELLRRIGKIERDIERITMEHDALFVLYTVMKRALLRRRPMPGMTVLTEKFFKKEMDLVEVERKRVQEAAKKAAEDAAAARKAAHPSGPQVGEGQSAGGAAGGSAGVPAGV